MTMAYPPPYCPADRVSGLRLAALPNAVSCARRHTRHLLREWQLAGFADDVELAVSEIITNSIKAVGGLTVPASYTAMYDHPPATVLLRLRLTTSGLYAEVWDPSEALPALSEAAAFDEGGRGLGLVAAVSDDWGFYPSQIGGKVTWCGVKVQAQTPAERATPGHDPDPPARTQWPMPDAARVRQVLDEPTQIDGLPGRVSTPDPYQPRFSTPISSTNHTHPTIPTERPCINSS
jgi:anti-sigma regulatory factor (Ser/Thr protein kinase)